MSRRLALLLLIVPFIALTIVSAVGAARGGAAAGVAPTVSAMGESFDGQVVQDGAGADVAIVPISGIIDSGRSTSTTAGGDTLVAELKAIGESDRYRGVILELDTPGGSVLPSAEVAEAVRNLRADGVKVVAWMRGTTASGGYYIASQADHIVASPDTVTGSIGVIMEYVNVSGLAQKVGVAPVVIKSGALKDMGSPFRGLTPEERRVLQGLIDEAYGRFVDVVASGRHLDRSTVRRLADGRIYTGTQALDNGLVDELGTRSDAYDAMAKLLGKPGDGDRLNVSTYEQQLDFLDQLLGVTSQQGTLASMLRWALGASSAAPLSDVATGAPGTGSPTAPGGVRLLYQSVIA